MHVTRESSNPAMTGRGVGRPGSLLLTGAAGLRAGLLVRFALLMGALGGLVEAGYLTVRQWIKHQPAAWYNPDVLWMAPLATALALVLLALPLVAVARLVRIGLAPATFLFAFPGVYGLAQAPGIALHPVAELVLSLGFAVALARAAAQRPAQAKRLIRLSTPAVAVLLMLLAIRGAASLPDVSERRGLARLSAPPAGMPNVVLIILDTVRAANLSLYGYERPTTPNIDTWAAEGVTFEHAISTAPWTLPSHASMFTGHYNFTVETGVNRSLDRRYPTLAEVLAENGYATAAFVANLGYTTRASGLHRGFARYEDFPVEAGMFVNSAWLPRRVSGYLGYLPAFPRWPIPKTAERINEDFFHWLDQPRDRPFFAFLNYYDAHSPYRAPAEYRARFGPPSEDEFTHGKQYTTEELAPWINAYDGSIAYIDDQLARLFETLETRGLRDNTLVVITSDHGEMFGERGQVEHTSGLYMPVLHVPLAMVFPNALPAGLRVADPVTLRDLPATIMEAAGLADASPIPGRSLAGHWSARGHDGAASPLLAELDRHDLAAPWTPSYRGNMKSLLDGGLHYIRNGDGSEELYDPIADPAAAKDLIDAPALRLVIGRFRAALDAILRID